MNYGGAPFYPAMRGRGGFGGPRFGGGGPRMPWRGGGGVGPRGGFVGRGGGGGAVGGWGQFDDDVDFQQAAPVFGDGGAAFQRPQAPAMGPGVGGVGGGGGGGGGFGPWHMNPAEVMAWLDHQHPFVLKRIHFHARWLLQQHGFDPDEEGGGEEGGDDGEEEEGGAGDTTGWYNDEVSSAQTPVPNPDQANAGAAASGTSNNPPPTKKARHPGFGWQKNAMQWTPSGWVVKDTSHKVTTTMRPLPEPETIPPQTGAFPEANADREKLKMLKNNVSMMQFELNKICKRFKIIALNKEDLSVYPEEQQSRLKVAINCVAAAEKTLSDFQTFLKEDKYKEWNEEQRKAHEEKVKQMIGETPTGVPHKRKEDAPQQENSGQEAEANPNASKVAGKAPIAFQPGGNLSV